MDGIFRGDVSISNMMRNVINRSGSNSRGSRAVGPSSTGASSRSGYVPSSSSRPVVEPRASQRQVASLRESSKRQSSNSSSQVRTSLGSQCIEISPRQPSSQGTPRLGHSSSRRDPYSLSSGGYGNAKSVSCAGSDPTGHVNVNVNVNANGSRAMQSLPNISGASNSNSNSSSSGLSTMFNSLRLPGGCEGRSPGDMKGGGSAISSRASELQYSQTRGSRSARGRSVVSIDNPVVAAKEAAAAAVGTSSGGKSVVCDKCDGKHATDNCPYFKKDREKHADATSRGKGLGSASSVLPGATIKNGRVVRQPGDGSCLFHSMAYGLGLGLGSANSLRAEICQFIVANPGMKISDTPISDWVRWDSGTSVGDYAKRMSRGAWGKLLSALL
mgnify:CR=1 FL=1